jgi:hypothetical protein
MTTTMEQIASIELGIQALLNDNDSELATFHNERRIAALAEMRAVKDQLWDTERRQRASKRNQQSNSQRHR